jgi:Tol biopolymer transport system component
LPSLAPDGEEVAFLHSPRNDGKYHIRITSVTKPNAEQVANTSNVSDVAWSSTGDWLAYVQNWSDETLEGQLSLVRPNGDDPHIVVRSGDAPDWSPDGKKLVYVHNGSIWTVNSDGTGAQLLIRDGHSPAWSRDGELITFMRPEKCGRSICPEHVYLAFADGSNPHEVGPAYSDERRLAWLPDPYE